MKLVVAEINDKRLLLVASDLRMSREEVVKTYRDRFRIDNPFFRDCKQEMGLADFHTRRFRALVAHTVLCFLSHTLVSLVRLFDGSLVGKSVGWVKENLFRAVAGVRCVGRRLAVMLGRGLELPPRCAMQSPFSHNKNGLRIECGHLTIQASCAASRALADPARETDQAAIPLKKKSPSSP